MGAICAGHSTKFGGWHPCIKSWDDQHCRAAGVKCSCETGGEIFPHQTIERLSTRLAALAAAGDALAADANRCLTCRKHPAVQGWREARREVEA
jgi:hypothetical protein